MRKVMTLGLFLTLLLSPLAYAAAVVDAGNTTCPVGGEKVSGKDFVEVEGKRYGLCCPMCADKLKKHPEKYLSAAPNEAAAHQDHQEHSM